MLESQESGQAMAPWTEAREPVSIETIDEIVARAGLGRLDLIKLDVEGSEVDALRGARRTISRLRPIILLEAEEERLASQGQTKGDLLEVLDEFGYDLWVFDAQSAQLRPAVATDEPEGNAIAAARGWAPPVLA
jgi:hypothetical protein